MATLIGIPLCLDDQGRWRPGHEYLYTELRYAQAVQDVGGAPVHLPIQKDVDALLENLHGLLLPGGDDFPPPAPCPEAVSFRPASERQLEFDRRLLARALELRMPVLGICYGMQLLSLHLGGTLLYDIARDRPDADSHQLPEAEDRHALVVEPGSALQKILGADPGPVNSLHHQGLAQPGEGLKVCARAGDGLIEAVEHVEHPFCIGVQWHPERLTGTHRDALFGAFIAACSAPLQGGGS
jgi:putative glutamine amidotransferase